MNTRRYKITAWVDVPVTFGQPIKDEDSMQEYLENKLAEDKIYGDFEIERAPLPMEVSGELFYSDPEDITSFNHPVGFIAPDGIFYGLEGDSEGLAHIALAGQLYDYYKDIYPVDIKSDFGTDYTLELMGFIKVHDCEIRYYQKEGHIKYWTDAQMLTLHKWIKEREKRDKELPYELHSDSIIFCGLDRNTYMSSTKFTQMDKFAIMRCFIDI